MNTAMATRPAPATDAPIPTAMMEPVSTIALLDEVAAAATGVAVLLMLGLDVANALVGVSEKVEGVGVWDVIGALKDVTNVVELTTTVELASAAPAAFCTGGVPTVVPEEALAVADGAMVGAAAAGDDAADESGMVDIMGGGNVWMASALPGVAAGIPNTAVDVLQHRVFSAADSQQ